MSDKDYIIHNPNGTTMTLAELKAAWPKDEPDYPDIIPITYNRCPVCKAVWLDVKEYCSDCGWPDGPR